MRKVFLKVLFIVVLIVGAFYLNPTNIYATETVISITSGEEYTYEKFIIDGVVWVFVFDESGTVIEIYPDVCGGPHHGGH